MASLIRKWRHNKYLYSHSFAVTFALTLSIILEYIVMSFQICQDVRITNSVCLSPLRVFFMSGGVIFLWYAALLHLLWAVLLWGSPALVSTTPVAGLYWLCGSSWIMLSGVLALGSGLALWMIWHTKESTVWYGVLQQVLVLISGVSGVLAVVAGQYADGAVYPRAFILADQAPAILAAVGHSIALYVYHVECRKCPFKS